MAGSQVDLLEASASITLGSKDTVSGEIDTIGESNGPSGLNTSKENSKTPWVDLFKPKCDRKDMLRLEFVAPVNGGAVIEDNELIVFKEPWPFALLGCFAGRFPVQYRGGPLQNSKGGIFSLWETLVP
nr:uncharacterized protein LOC111395991 [Ipomoea batatas]